MAVYRQYKCVCACRCHYGWMSAGSTSMCVPVMCHYGWMSAGSTSMCAPVGVIMDGCLQAVQVCVCL